MRDAAEIVPQQGRAAVLLCALVLVLLPWQEVGDQRTLPDLVQLFLLAAVLLLPTVARPPLSDGLGLGWLVAVMAWGAAGVLRSGYRFSAGLEVWALGIAAIGFVALAHSPMVAPVRRRLAGALVAGAIVQAGWALALAGPERASGAFVNRNFLAAYLNVALAVALVQAIDRRGKARAVAILAALPIALAVLWTGSRGGVIGLVALLIVLIPYRRVLDLLSTVPGRAMAVALGAVLLVVLPLSIVIGVRSGEVDPYRYERLSIWKASLSAASEQPWIGLGPGQLQWVAPRYNFPLEGYPFRYSRVWKTAHNLPLQRLAEEGIIGVVLAAGFLLALVRALRAKVRCTGDSLARAALAALAAIMAQGMVDTPSEHPAVLLSLAVLAGLALAPTAPGPESTSAAAGGQALPVARRLGLPGLAVIGVAVWVLLVAPWMASRSWQQYSSDSDTVRALGSLQRALEWNPHHRDYAYTLGLTAARSSRELSLEQLAYADNSLARAARIDPHDDRAQTERGNLMMRAAAEGVVPAESALRAALRRYEEALRRDPLNPRLYLSAGLASRRLGEFDRAREFAHSAAALEPNYLDAHLLAADASQQIGEIKAARRELDRFEVARRTLRGHRPRNRYEEDLVKYNDAVLRGLQESLK
ncbi:MAG: O-antigen ligase family protein [Acidobacteriota bacterium]